MLYGGGIATIKRVVTLSVKIIIPNNLYSIIQVVRLGIKTTVYNKIQPRQITLQLPFSNTYIHFAKYL